MKRYPGSWLIILTAAVCMLPLTAAAQTSYSLYDLCRIANDNAEQITIAREDVFIARQEEKRALSVLIPRLSAFASHTNYDNESMNRPDVTSTGIKFTQSFTLNGKELIALDVTRRSIEEKELSLDSIRSQYLLQISQVYFQILSAMRNFEIAQADLIRLEKHRNAVTEKVNVGSLTKTALYRAEAELSSSKTQLVRAKNAVSQARAALKNLVEIEDSFTVSKADVLKISEFKCTPKEIRERALANRPEIQESLKQIDIARKTIRYEKSDYWPRITIEGGYTDTRARYGMGNASVTNSDDQFSITGELVFTLYDGGLRNGTIQQALARERKASNALAMQKRSILFEVEQAFLEFETTKSVLITLKDELKAARENFNAVNMQFEYGMADSVDIMDANTLLVSAERKIAEARYTYTLSVLKIIYTQGDLLDFLLNKA